MIELSESAKAEVAEMASKLQRARFAYHRNGTSDLADDEYDRLKTALRAIAPYHPEVTAVGAPPDPKSLLAKVKHQIMMGSVYNSKDYSKKDDYTDGLRAWWERNGRQAVFAELKGDGLSLRLTYNKGMLVQAATRGDGLEGEDVTHNVRLFQKLPQYLPTPFTGDVRGEAILYNEDWLALGEAGKKNPRNTAAGALGSKTSGGDVCRRMRFHAFDLVGPDGRPIDASGHQIRYKSDLYFYLAKLGFEVFSMYVLAERFDQMLTFNNEVEAARDSLPHDIDGIVYYIDDLQYQYEKGMDSSNCWRSQCAFKFAASEAETTLTGVTWQCGNMGQHTPVGNLAPVDIGGVTVRNASLANPSILAKLGIQIGDRVVVVRSGDVIPKVLRKAESQDTGYPRTDIPVPKDCIVCNGPLGNRTNVDGSAGVVVMCLNDSCPAKVPGKVDRWATSLNIMGLGEAVIGALTEVRQREAVPDFPGENVKDPGYIGTFSDPNYRIVNSVADLYKLREEDLKDLKINGKRFGTKAKKLIEEIDKARNLTVEQLVGSLGIPMLGTGRAELIVNAFRKLDLNDGLTNDALDHPMAWTTNYNDDPAHSILRTYADRLGIPRIAEEIQIGLDQARPTIEALLQAGVRIKGPAKPVEVEAGSALVGKSFCFTGVRLKPEQVERLKQLGGIEKSGVSADLHFLVCADKNSTSSKAVKARSLEVPVIDLNDFLEMIK